MDFKKVFKPQQCLSAMSIDKLHKNKKMWRYVFWMDVFLEIVFLFMAGVVGSMLVNDVMLLSTSPILVCLLLFGVVSVMNMFMIFVVWFSVESTYYKMLENQADIMMFLKENIDY